MLEVMCTCMHVVQIDISVQLEEIKRNGIYTFLSDTYSCICIRVINMILNDSISLDPTLTDFN
jgi:hypothetical protein